MRALVMAIVLWFGLGTVVEAAPREREILTERPSGFWTSNRPAQGGAYRWRLLGIGVVIAAGMGFVILRTLRRANDARAHRNRDSV